MQPHLYMENQVKNVPSLCVFGISFNCINAPHHPILQARFMPVVRGRKIFSDHVLKPDQELARLLGTKSTKRARNQRANPCRKS